jgi:hypothetical protein
MPEYSLTCDKALEEWFIRQVFVVFLKMLFGWGDQFNSSELEAIIGQRSYRQHFGGVSYPRFSNREIMSPTSPRWKRLDQRLSVVSMKRLAYLDSIGLDCNETRTQCQQCYSDKRSWDHPDVCSLADIVKASCILV